MQTAHHRKSNSNSVNSQAIMSGKHQIGGPSGIGMKYIKPSELSLDLIGPSGGVRNHGIKGAHGIHNQTTLAGGGPNTSTNGNNNVANILQNFRTPQNMNNIN